MCSDPTGAISPIPQQGDPPPLSYNELMALVYIVQTDLAMLKRVNLAGVLDDMIEQHTRLMDRLAELAQSRRQDPPQKNSFPQEAQQ